MVVGDHVLDRLDDCDYLAGADEKRLADMHACFETKRSLRYSPPEAVTVLCGCSSR